jgi:RNA polymerase sigma factor (sigma-70 family)
MTTDELYRKMHDPLAAYFANVCRSQEADDLVQELFVSYLQALCEGASIQTPEHWLWRAARNLAIDCYRLATRRPILISLELAGQGIADPLQQDPLELVCRGDTYDALTALVHGLPANQRQALAVRYADMCPLRHREVARCLGISLSAARARHTRAVANLRVLTGRRRRPAISALQQKGDKR